MKTEIEFIAQVQLAKDALQQFIKITMGKEYDNAEPIKHGATKQHAVGKFIVHRECCACLDGKGKLSLFIMHHFFWSNICIAIY